MFESILKLSTRFNMEIDGDSFVQEQQSTINNQQNMNYLGKSKTRLTIHTAISSQHCE